jgi:trehalose 6-phosphate synthase
MAYRRRLIVVSNRGPAVHARDESGHLVARRGGGGLVTALDSLAGDHDVTWIASAISDGDREMAASTGGALEEVSRRGSPFRLLLIDHDRDAYDRYYNVVANPMLWFVQHRLWEIARSPSLDERFTEAWDDGYVTVNRRFAEAVCAELERSPDAVVLFHDYHLYLAPRFVRDAHPHALLAHFVHIPWVGPGSWTILGEQRRRAIHDGLLANDLVGFHTDRWRRAFVEAAVSIVGAEARGMELKHEGRRVMTIARAISVDVEEFEAFAGDAAVLERRAELTAERPERLIARVDRTDPSKNILRGLRAFELLLERHPEHRDRVRLLALLDPSRQDIPEYASYTEEIERQAAELNRRFDGAVDLRIGDDFPLSVAAYQEYDVLFVNAVVDGLNLVAKEGPLVNERDGVLVLSEGAGAADELSPWALVVNPFDVAEQAGALHEALVMPADERKQRIEALRAHVRDRDISWWTAELLADLDRVAEPTGG